MASFKKKIIEGQGKTSFLIQIVLGQPASGLWMQFQGKIRKISMVFSIFTLFIISPSRARNREVQEVRHKFALCNVQ